jgi:K+-transporting ATPase ATPase C chain
MRLALFRALVFALASLLLFGGGYHGVLWIVGRVAFPDRAEGSLVRRADGTVVGSRLIAQPFTRDVYVHPRPSAVAYDASATGGSNYGPANPEQVRLMTERRDATARREGVSPARVPIDLLTASGSGLDPHLSPEAVALQLPRVARARGVDVARVRAIAAAHVEPPLGGLFGQARINVLLLNLALDDAFAITGSSQR